MKTIKSYSRSESSIKKYSQFLENKKEGKTEKSIIIEVDENKVEKDKDSDNKNED